MGAALKYKDTSRSPKTIKNWGERKLMCERCALEEGVRVACGSALGYIRKVVPIKDGCSTTHEQMINFVSKSSTPLPKNAFWRRYPDLHDGDGVVFGVLYTQASQPGCMPKFRSTHMVFKDDPPSDPQNSFLVALKTPIGNSDEPLKLEPVEPVSAPNDGPIVANLFVEKHGGHVAFEYANKYNGPPQPKRARSPRSTESRRSPCLSPQLPRLSAQPAPALEHVESQKPRRSPRFSDPPAPEHVGSPEPQRPRRSLLLNRQPAPEHVGSSTGSPTSDEPLSSEESSPEASSNPSVDVAGWLAS